MKYSKVTKPSPKKAEKGNTENKVGKLESIAKILASIAVVIKAILEIFHHK